MDNIGQKLKEYFDGQGITQKDIADELGVSKAYINSLFTNKRAFGKEQAEIWENHFGLSKAWLLTGEGDMLVSKDSRDPAETRPRIPMTVAAGSLSGFADDIQYNDWEQYPVIKAFPPYDFTIVVKGDSMEPKFEGGDEVAIKKVYDFIEWGKTYVLDTRDGAVLKRLYDEGDKFKCVSFNHEYPDFEVNKEDVFGVYKVVGLIRI